MSGRDWRGAVLFLLLVIGTGPLVARSVLKISKVPANTPPADTLFVAGSFNGWNPHSSAYALAKNAAGSYQISLPARLGAIEYKFTNTCSARP